MYTAAINDRLENFNKEEASMELRGELINSQLSSKTNKDERCNSKLEFSLDNNGDVCNSVTREAEIGIMGEEKQEKEGDVGKLEQKWENKEKYP
ncbi:hypothetical protein Glove_658g10 [Diversispora epigaea]|uniref:Uncharacterized protein n=1 Tax=Diversispora epigaea TaxID=1348612 RepID=A0A397G6R6_9GLOM|nr:hypothetical protein Glove_658g10 [Diversispora epigaea]